MPVENGISQLLSAEDMTRLSRLSLGSIMGDIAGTVFGSILMLFINQNYYNKRLELFVN